MNNIRVTIIQDNTCTANLMTKIFRETKDCTVVSVFLNKEDAVASINNFSSDVIISGIKMSTELNGFQAAQKMRESVCTPIVFYSASLCQDLIEQCLSLENTTFLSKNTSIPKLLLSVRNMASSNMAMVS